MRSRLDSRPRCVAVSMSPPIWLVGSWERSEDGARSGAPGGWLKDRIIGSVLSVDMTTRCDSPADDVAGVELDAPVKSCCGKRPDFAEDSEVLIPSPPPPPPSATSKAGGESCGDENTRLK